MCQINGKSVTKRRILGHFLLNNSKEGIMSINLAIDIRKLI